ncbi:hypothetical protein SAFG77S_01866 [Streptomyces afghaniensis]|uniref:hypothetical protein n=1 Tax=Streptomyces afghaniensis TaxID=66865 RepID=UPI000560C388|nr:hypothetical protein [Streptomyces afghaniensis]
MRTAEREQHILRALEAHSQADAAERRPFPLKRGNTMLPVVKVPLSVPLLNAKSFRIAPALVDHPSGAEVLADPESPKAQIVIAELVRSSHKFAEELKRSLKEGQDEPGVITRSGVLINANSRCVLMRELVAEGELRDDAIRVAVLPSDVGAAELFDLEAVLQKQRDHKDDYDLVSELMMLRTLHEEGGMTEQQISKRQRLSTKDVMLRFRVLTLMERARHLVDPPMRIKSFGGRATQLQNWKELEERVRKIDDREGPEAGDDHIREWLHLHLLGLGSVHNLRAATPGWVDKHLKGALASGGDIGTKIADSMRGANSSSENLIRGQGDGLDLLDFGRATHKRTPSTIRSLLDLTVAVTKAGPTGVIELPDGSKRSGDEVIKVLKETANAGLKESQIRLEAGKRLEAPETLLTRSRSTLIAANEAIYDVIEQQEFAANIDACMSLLDELSSQIDIARESLEQFGDGN